MATTTSESLSVFTIGDVVLANPKEAASLLTIVIFFAVAAQYLFIALRKSKISAVRMVFNSFSNSLLTIGAISLVFSFASQAVGGVNERWLLLLRWSQVVLLTLLLQLFVGTIIGTVILRKIWISFDRTEARIPSSTYAQATATSAALERSFVDKYTAILHIVFVKDVAFMVQSLAAAAAAAAEGRRRLSSRRDALRRKLGAMLVAARERDELELQSTGARNPDGTLKTEHSAGANADAAGGGGNADLEATFLGQAPTRSATPLLLSSVLQNALHTQMSDLADITWLSWLMLVFLVAANSVRMFALPGKLQSKPVSEFTLDDRTLNILTFIGLVGWIPTAVFLIVLGLFFRNFRNYTVMADSVLTLTKDVDTMGPALEAGRVKVTTGAVWLPPEPRDYERHRNQQHQQQQRQQLRDSDDDGEYGDGEDASSTSQHHQLEDPSMYFLRGNRSFTLLALRVPMLMVELYSAIFFIGMIGDVTSTFGARLSYVLPVALLPLLIVWFTIPVGAFMLACLSSMGSRLGEDDLAEAFLSPGEWRELLGDEVAIDEHGVDNEYGKDPIATDSNMCAHCEDRINEIRELEERIQSLEKLCRKFGLRTGEYRGSAKQHHHQEIPDHYHYHHQHHRDDSNIKSSSNNNFFLPTTVSEDGYSDDLNLLNNNNNNKSDQKQRKQADGDNDSDFVELKRVQSSSFHSPAHRNVTSNNASSSYLLAPDNVQAASYQDRSHRELASSFHQERRQQQQQQQQNINFSNKTPRGPTNAAMAGATTTTTTTTTASTTPKSTSISHPTLQNQNNNTMRPSHPGIPLLSTSALASPTMSTTAPVRRGATTFQNVSSSSFASPSSVVYTPRQNVGGDAMLKNVNNALRHVL